MSLALSKQVVGQNNIFTFQNTILKTVYHGDQAWITSKSLSQALQYKDEKAVSIIYNRNSDEFTNKMSLVINLTTKGFGNGSSQKETRLFSLRGCHLIAMFSRTKVAKEFRKWVLDILDKEAQNTPPSLIPPNETLILERLEEMENAISVLSEKDSTVKKPIYSFTHIDFDPKKTYSKEQIIEFKKQMIATAKDMGVPLYYRSDLNKLIKVPQTGLQVMFDIVCERAW